MADKTVIKLNNIPHGFYEKGMKSYFRQFGKVKNVLLVRSKKTHKSRGFGFVEFELPQVALAAAEAMHNYLFFNQVLKCRQMKRSDLPKNLFKNNKGPTSLVTNKRNHNVEVRDQKNIIKNHEKIIKVMKIYENMGIKFDCLIINKPA